MNKPSEFVQQGVASKAIAGTAGALAGKRVIDLSRVLAGPYCTQMLADHGADVIKIEPPQGDETRTLGPPFVGDTAAYYRGLNRNKAALALDLSNAMARNVLLRLLADADVLVENFLPGTMEKWNLGYDEVLAPRFPRLVYCRITGFGAHGPFGGLPGYDAVLQAMCGLMSVNGTADSGPTRVGVPIVDLTTGLTAVIGILLALSEREHSGRGQLVETSLYDTALSLLHPHAASWFASGNEPELMGSAHPNISPYDRFATKSGNVFIGVVNDRQFRKFCQLIGRDELAADERFTTNRLRVENRQALNSEIESSLRDEDGARLCERLMAAGVPAGAVNKLSEVLQHPHTAASGMVVEAPGYRGIGTPIKLKRTPATMRCAPPDFSADAREVLARAGCDDSEVSSLAAAGALHLQPLQSKPRPKQ